MSRVNSICVQDGIKLTRKFCILFEQTFGKKVNGEVMDSIDMLIKELIKKNQKKFVVKFKQSYISLDKLDREFINEKVLNKKSDLYEKRSSSSYYRLRNNAFNTFVKNYKNN